ncbi:MAG: tetratricopeptide repeat protein [Proteobacteria bacterium]|nr:tetratricopeptide repeat protein [Pseudomonadota bacterium]
MDKEKVLVAAQKYADKEQYGKAIREIQRIIGDNQDDCRLLLRLASYYEGDNKTAEALQTYARVASIYRTQGSYQKALAVLKQAQKIAPEDNGLALSAAELYSAIGLPHEAMSQLDRSLLNCDSHSKSYIKTLQMMVRVDSENVQTRMKYAKVLLSEGDTEGALRQYNLALAQLLSKDRLVDYVQTAREYLKLSPKDAEVLKNVADIYVKMNRFNETIGILNDLRDEERTPEIHEILAKCYVSLKRPKDAVRELKTLAHKHETSGMSSDMIEDVWLRAQQLDPNDAEVSAALGGELPMLSESALNVVTTARSSSEEPVQSRGSSLNRSLELSNHFSQALNAYHQGNIRQAQEICIKNISEDERHLPSLRLLAEIYENNHDNVSLAQIERKLAKAVYETDLDEAVRHVLRAEKCTPRAWENFNLMLVFGLEPARYGMSAPENSSPRINVQSFVSASNALPPRVSAAVGTPSSPLSSLSPNTSLPASSASGVPTLGQLPKTGIRTSSNPFEGNLLSSAVLSPSHSALTSHLSSSAIRQPPPIPRSIGRTIDIPVPIQAIPNDVLSDLKILESDSQRQAISRQQSSMPSERVDEKSTASSDSLFEPGSSSLDEALNNVFSSLFNDSPLEEATKAETRIPGVTSSKYDDATYDPRLHGRPVKVSGHESLKSSDPTYNPKLDMQRERVAPAWSKPTPNRTVIPESELPRVQEVLQEVEFYASLTLFEDARSLLDTLIAEFGDIGIIRTTRLKLNAM